MISVVIPAHNESDRLSATVRSIARTRASAIPVEVIIADDGSSDGGVLGFAHEASTLSSPGFEVSIIRLERRVGNYRARNAAARLARGELLLFTDAHVSFSPGWDSVVWGAAATNVVLAGSVADSASSFVGSGLKLMCPDMWTHWRTTRRREPAEVGASPCAATVIHRSTFHWLGGYDDELRLYGGGESEFGIHCWLSGVSIRTCPEFVVTHAFKSRTAYRAQWPRMKTDVVHNLLRIGLVYLDDLDAALTLNFFATTEPEAFRAAWRLLSLERIASRRRELSHTLKHDFAWFAQRFALKLRNGQPHPASIRARPEPA